MIESFLRQERCREQTTILQYFCWCLASPSNGLHRVYAPTAVCSGRLEIQSMYCYLLTAPKLLGYFFATSHAIATSTCLSFRYVASKSLGTQFPSPAHSARDFAGGLQSLRRYGVPDEFPEPLQMSLSMTKDLAVPGRWSQRIILLLPRTSTCTRFFFFLTKQM